MNTFNSNFKPEKHRLSDTFWIDKLDLDKFLFESL